MAMKTYLVIRHHAGDRDWRPGDFRDADEREVAHLLGTCLREVTAADAGAAPVQKPAKPRSARGAAQK